jgi:hypothetical protein
MASDTLSVEKVAKNYADQGGEKAKEAVEIYKRIGSKNALINGGDLAFNQKQFPTAYLMYSKAQYAPGLKKCAEKMFDLGQEEEANNIYVEMVTAYMKTAQTEEVEKLGKQNVAKMNYNLASRIYDKAGNLALSKKYAAYNKIMQLDLDSAKIMLEAIGETDLLKAIESNDKYLSMLKLSKNDFEDWRRQRPTVGTETDAEGRTIPKATDEVMLVDFYKNIKDAIVDDCITISKNVPPISNATLKSMMKASFLEYPAVGKILDPNTFSVKIPKANVQIKDVYLK